MDKKYSDRSGPVNGNREGSSAQVFEDQALEQASGGSEEKKRKMYNFICSACGLITFGEDEPVTACAFCGSKDGQMKYITG